MELVLRKDDLEFGLELLAITEQNLARVFEGVGRNELAMTQATFSDCINRAGGMISDKQLKADTFSLVNSAEFAEVVAHFIRTGQWYEGKVRDRLFYLTAAAHEKAKAAQSGPTDPPTPNP
jgi:hypothetical protein